MRESVKEKKVQKRYDEEFKRQAVELLIHSGKTQAQICPGTGGQCIQSDSVGRPTWGI
jgi:transposase-like protein